MHHPIEIAVAEPYRLDLTVLVLRRTSSNVVDRLCGGRYLRCFETPRGIVVCEAARSPRGLTVELHGPAGDAAPWAGLIERMLGARYDIAPFLRAIEHVPWLNALAARMAGLRPPCYPMVWEALVNAIVFQQVSISAASAIMGRVVTALVAPFEHRGETLYPFPGPARLRDSGDDELRAAGLSASKVLALRRVATRILDGDLSEEVIAGLPTPQAVEYLCRSRGVGPWTAAVALLRGFGRLDVFPGGDSGVAQSIKLASGDAHVELAPLLERLGAHRGLLYFLLLLARLEARGEVPAAAAIRCDAAPAALASRRDEIPAAPLKPSPHRVRS